METRNVKFWVVLLAALTVLLHGSHSASGVAYYVGPSPAGSGDGTSWANRAYYRNYDFWDDIHDELNDHWIDVMFADGTYNDGTLVLNRIGNPRNQLTLEANTTYGAVFTGSYSHYITMAGSNNIELHGFRFTGNVSSFAVSCSRNGDDPARNLVFHYCKFEDLTNATYGALGLTDYCYNIYVRRCTFDNVGYDVHAHHIYADGRSMDIILSECDFIDCTGDYVRFRNDTDYCIVDGCYFHSTDSDYNIRFIDIPVMNESGYPPGEYFGTNFQITENDFVYDEYGGDCRVAIVFLSQGWESPEHDYMLNTSEAATLNSGTTSAKRSLLLGDMGIDYTKLHIYDNYYNPKVDHSFSYRQYDYWGSYHTYWDRPPYEDYTEPGIDVPMQSGELASMPKVRNGGFEWKGDRRRCWKTFEGVAPYDHAGLYGSRAVMLREENSLQEFGTWISEPACPTYIYLLFAIGETNGDGCGNDDVRFKVQLHHDEIDNEYLAFAVDEQGRCGYMTSYYNFVPVSALGTIQFSNDYNNDGDYSDAGDTLYYYQLAFMVHYEESTHHYNIYRGNVNQRGDYTNKAYNVNHWVNGDAVQGDVIGLLRFSGYGADVIIDDVH